MCVKEVWLPLKRKAIVTVNTSFQSSNKTTKVKFPNFWGFFVCVVEIKSREILILSECYILQKLLKMQLYDDEVFECHTCTLYLVDDIKCFQNVQVFAELYVSMTRTFHCCLNFSAQRRTEWTSLSIRESVHRRCITRLCVHCPFYECIKNQTVVLQYLNSYVQFSVIK